MTLHNHPYHVKAAISHLADQAIKTKSDEREPVDAMLRKFGDNAVQMVKQLGATNDEVKQLRDDFKSKSSALEAQLAQLEQRAARVSFGGGEPYREKSIGARFTESQELQHFAEKAASSGKVSLSMKATLTSATTNAAGSVGAGLVATRDPEIVTLVRPRLTIRNLLPTIQVSGNSVEVLKETGHNLNAGMVAEGAAKPSSDLQLALVTLPIRTIAHWMKASRQILDDMPQLQGLIDTELLYGLAAKEESQILNGDGTGQNITGLIPQATAFTAPYAITGATSIDMLAQAICQLALASYEVDGAVVNTADWWRMKTLKDAGGNYIIGNPAGGTGDNLWGLPIVPTTGISIDKFLVGSFQQAGVLYDRWTARIEVGYENDDFTKNLVTILAEERIGLAVKRGGALVYGDFGLVA